MLDYINQLDANVLNDAGSISHKKAVEKTKLEYEKYQMKELSPIEKEYLNPINEINKIVENLNNN